MKTPKKPQVVDLETGEIIPFEEIGVSKVNLNRVPRKATDILAEIAPQGENVKASQIIGTEIIIHAVRPFQGVHGNALFCIFTDATGAMFNTVIGGQIVAPKLWALRNDLPVSFKIIDKEGGSFGHYYDIE
jgi:hypothetical protein